MLLFCHTDATILLRSYILRREPRNKKVIMPYLHKNNTILAIKHTRV